MPTDSTKPKVSIVILTHNRMEILRHSLSSVLELDWPRLEIIVVDNVSTDGTPDIIRGEFGNRVRVVPRAVDSPCGGRNDGFRAATGDYILSIDNDMVFPQKDSIATAIMLLEQSPDVAVLTFQIAGQDNPSVPLHEHWWHPVSYESGKHTSFYTDYFSEGAVFFRAEVIRKLGAYDDAYFGGFEGVDLAWKLLARGYNILYTPTVTCIELQVSRSRQRLRTEWNYYFLRNKLWTAWKHLPPLHAICYALPRIVKDSWFAFRYGWADLWLAAVREGVFPPRHIRAQRNPLSRAAWRRIRVIRQGHAAPPAFKTRIHAVRTATSGN